MRFYFYNINEIQFYVKNDLLLKAIKQLQSIELKQTPEYIKVLQIFTKSIYNLLQNEYSQQIDEIQSILNPLTEFTSTSYNDIDTFIKYATKYNTPKLTTQSNKAPTTNLYKQPEPNIFQGIVVSSVIGFILYDLRYNII